MSPPASQREGGPGIALGERALAELAEAERLFASTGEALHHGIHFGRKALRRCRAALALGGERFGERAERLDRRLRRLLRSLSRERDAQAVIEHLDALVEEGRLDPDLAARVREALVARRDRIVGRRLARDPGLARLRTRLREITRAVADLPWQALGEGQLRRALLRQRKRALRAGERAAGGGEEELHRYRRRLRRLRQQLTLLKAATGRSYARYGIHPDPADRLSRLRDALLLARAVRTLRELPPPLRRSLLAALVPAQEPEPT
jgi:CHAD domain-containing protein